MMTRWITADGEHSAELRELIRHARAGESWADIAQIFYPNRPETGGHSCHKIFALYAAADDRDARRDALKRIKFNKDRPYRNRGVGGGSSARPEPGVPREKIDPWAGMGECFR